MTFIKDLFLRESVSLRVVRARLARFLRQPHF